MQVTSLRRSALMLLEVINSPSKWSLSIWMQIRHRFHRVKALTPLQTNRDNVPLCLIH